MADRKNYNIRLIPTSSNKKYATSLRDTNSKAESRYLSKNKLSDEWKNWYDLPEDKIGGAVAQVVDRIEVNNYEERNRFMRYARLYGNYEALGWSQLAAANRSDTTSNKPVYNIIQSSVDTVNSKIARDNPAPYFITSGADYFEKLRAEKQTQFVQGIFQQQGLYEIANNDVFRDGCVYGLGGIEFSLNKHTNKIDAEWVFIDELKVDRYDGAKGKPRSMHRVVLMPKELLMSQYPDPEIQKKIESVTTNRPLVFRGQDSVVDFVAIRKSWHLANGPDHPGRYVVTIDNEVLEDSQYDFEVFPFAFFRWMKKAVGFYGRGIAEEILSGQIEINKILMFIQQCQELQAVPLIFVEASSQVAEDALLSNNIARQVKYKGTAPIPVSPEGCGPEIYQHLQWWVTNCYGKVGVSQTSATGTKQQGVNSGVAMRTMVDIESSRFIQISKNWEQFFVDCAEIIMLLGKQAYEKDPSFSVDFVDQRSKILKSIPWKKISKADDVFVIKCDTISGFPQTAAGRIQTVTEFISNHFISLERGMELLNIDPDLEDEVKLATSSLRLCEKSLSAMVEDNEYSHPEKYMNLKLALAVSAATYNQLKLDGCPEDRLQLVRQWIDEICTLLGAPDPQLTLIQNIFSPQAPPAPAPITAPQAGLQPVRAA